MARSALVSSHQRRDFESRALPSTAARRAARQVDCAALRVEHRARHVGHDARDLFARGEPRDRARERLASGGDGIA